MISSEMEPFKKPLFSLGDIDVFAPGSPKWRKFNEFYCVSWDLVIIRLLASPGPKT